MGKRIGFLSNQLDNRGTGNALYNYAHYNQELLGNESLIYTFLDNPRHDDAAFEKFQKEFHGVYNADSGHGNLDALYHIKSGFDDGFRPTNDIPYLVHSVFDNQPHGTVYATVSPWMGERFSLPYVPHIVEVDPTTDNMRADLGIPQDAVVYGRHGGLDSFDIFWVWSEIAFFLNDYKDTYFIFMNTDAPIRHPRVISLPATIDEYEKKRFINTCDAMIHARGRGETFGLAVGEFAISGKPVITYSESGERAHLQELGPFALQYKDASGLRFQMERVHEGPLVSWGYGQYTPANVMKKFDEVFLSAVGKITG